MGRGRAEGGPARVLLAAAPEILSVALVAAMALMLNAAGLEAHAAARLDLDREFLASSLASAGAMLVAGLPSTSARDRSVAGLPALLWRNDRTSAYAELVPRLRLHPSSQRVKTAPKKPSQPWRPGVSRKKSPSNGTGKDSGGVSVKSAPASDAKKATT